MPTLDLFCDPFGILWEIHPMSKPIEICFCEDSYGITISTTGDGGGSMSSLIPRETCPYCGQEDCLYSCDESQAGGFNSEKDEDEDEEETLRNRIAGNAEADAVESFVLALVMAYERRGMIIPKDVIEEAITTTFDAIGSNC